MGQRQEKTYGKTATGVPITEDLIAEHAERAEAGFDVDEVPRRRRVGCPPIEAPERELRRTCDDRET
jgi:hypothetical protein